MIISHKNKFIFIANRKTGGTSVQAQLREHCGEDDILTGICYTGRSEYNRGINSEGWLGPDGWTKIRKEVGEKVWKEYFIFCFERNPWDKMISWYHWDNYFHIARGDGGVTFDYYCKKVAGQVSDFDLYGIKGGVAVDFVGHQSERLDRDYEWICNEKIGVRYSKLSRFKNFANPTPEKPYQAYYTDETEELVAKSFAREIELFGYVFK